MAYYRSFDNTRITYDEKGDGQPIIFLPGWGMGRAYFKKQLESLSSKYKIIAMDLRGLGDSDKENMPKPNIEIWAKDLKEFIDQRQLKKFIIVGWSMGAFVMWHYYDSYEKENLAGMVVLEMVGNLGEPGWATDENATMEHNYKEYLAGFVEGMFAVTPPRDELQRLIEETQKTPMPIAQHLNLVLENADFRQMLPKINIPALILYGKNLLFFTEEQEQETIRAIKNASSVIFQKSKHLPFWEETDEFNKVLTSFVDSL
jgi:pimeloyl-ACP methyl ester carboxylesterase